MDNTGYLPFPKGFATTAIHAGQNPEQWESLSVFPPIVLSATFKQPSPGKPKNQTSLYARWSNPTRDVLERSLAALENAKYGLCLSSGLGMVTTILGMFKTGDHIICNDDIYGGTNKLFNKVATPLGFTTSFIDITNLDNVVDNINNNTKMIWIETPTNPMLKVIDIKALSLVAKKRNLILAVDNTFLTPYLQRPLELGADLSVYSLTKYMNGHSDVIMGAIVLNNSDIYKKLKFLQSVMGIVPSPFDCSQVNRGLKTLTLRMKQHNQSSLIVAKYLETHPKVDQVIHPGLPSHPQHELFKKQTSGHSGIISFYIRGNIEDSKEFFSSLKLFTLAPSLGDCKSLIELPSMMSHFSIPAEQKTILKITDNLIRVSIGLEDVEDLIEDLNQALNCL